MSKQIILTNNKYSFLHVNISVSLTSHILWRVSECKTRTLWLNRLLCILTTRPGPFFIQIFILTFVYIQKQYTTMEYMIYYITHYTKLLTAIGTFYVYQWTVFVMISIITAVLYYSVHWHSLLYLFTHQSSLVGSTGGFRSA